MSEGSQANVDAWGQALEQQHLYGNAQILLTEMRYKSLFWDMWAVTLPLAQEGAGQLGRAGEEMGTQVPWGAGL